MSASRAALLLSLASLVACSPTATVPLPDAAMPFDAGADGAARPPRDLDASASVFHECSTDADCPSGVPCNHDFPRGMCTPRCTATGECQAGSVCSSTGSVCLPECRAGGAWCRDDAMCVGSACLASCSPRTDMPALACSPGSGSCVDNACTGAPPGASSLGAPCTAYTECATLRCLLESAGWPGGMCVRSARMVPADAYLADGPMPSGRCLDSEAIGTDAAATEGEAAYCLPRCASEADCRDGYRCERRGVFGAPLHTDGYCVRWGCTPNDPPCPAPRACRPVGASRTMACFAS